MTQKTLSGKEKRMMEAARLRYMEDCDNQEIADRIGLKETTIRDYFSGDDMDQFKRFYSDQELFKLQQSLEQDIRDGEQEAKNALSNALSLAEDSKDYRQVADTLLKLRKRKIELLQELGVIQMPKERKEVEQTSGEVVFNEEVVTEREEQQEKEEVEAE